KAPEGSGVPVGTAYHWFILSHQYVEKLNANDYITRMVGLKYKLAHRRAATGEWNASGDARRRHLVEILQCIIGELQREPEQLVPVPLRLDYSGKHYEGTAMPVPASCQQGACFDLDITLNNEHIGIMRQTPAGWKISEIKSKGLVNAIGGSGMGRMVMSHELWVMGK
ncbi:MAG: hypothetical protein KGJ06_06450, partial [Pseudomonadota bacterium]|nr:hypothetical protein [Pseudomonadota bacterium]